MASVDDRAALDRWEQEAAAAPKRDIPRTTVSGVPIDALYTPENIAGIDPETDLGYPGQYPFTRGAHATMYRSRLWTMRQFAGFGTPRQTNERFRFLLDKGQTGLSTAFDLPTVERRGGNGAVGADGASYREIIDVSNWDRSITVNTPGQSGQPGSPYYGNFLPIWEKDEYVPMSFSRGLVDSNAEHRLTLQP